MSWNPPDHFARTLIRHMRDAVVVTDEWFRVVAWLGGATEIFGYGPDEADGKHVLEDFGFRFPDGDADANTERLLAGEPVRANVQALRKDGHWIDLDVSIDALRDAAGTRIGTFSVARDMSRQRELEHQLRDSELLYRSAITVMEEGILVIGSDGRIRAANPAVQRMHGVTADALIGRTALTLGWKFLLPDGTACPVEALPGLRALRGEHVIREVLTSVQPGGVRRWLSISALPMRFNPDGTVESVIVSSEDITALREQEERLRESEERLRLVLEGSNDGFWDWHIPSGAVTFSDRWATMLGYRREELAPRIGTWAALVHPEELAPVQRQVDALLSGATPFFSAEHRMRTKDGAWRWILSRGKVVEHNADGLPVRAAGTHTDVTERREMDERLKEALAENERVVAQLREALENVKTLRGMLPICSRCKKVRREAGDWEQLEAYVARHTDAQFSHGYCEDCFEQDFPGAPAAPAERRKA